MYDICIYIYYDYNYVYSCLLNCLLYLFIQKLQPIQESKGQASGHPGTSVSGKAVRNTLGLKNHMPRRGAWVFLMFLLVPNQ